MEITLIRQYLSVKSTISKVSVNGVFFGYALEDPVRAIKEQGKTAIPYGFYPVIINHSERFKRAMPLLLNVPNFQGVRIHAGNTAEDTEGCILVGFDRGNNVIGKSKAAFDALFERISLALSAGDKVYCSIEHGTIPTPEPRSEGFVA